jgi:hypothetical protein
MKIKRNLIQTYPPRRLRVWSIAVFLLTVSATGVNAQQWTTNNLPPGLIA